MSQRYAIKACVVSNVGNVRNNNEDNYSLNGIFRKDVNINISDAEVCLAGDDHDPPAVFAVLDGMGGEAYGEEASLIAAGSLHAYDIADVRQKAEADILGINYRICDKAGELHAGRMGSTAVMIYTDGISAIPVNVGDSRAYLYRDGSLTQISQDHDEASRKVRMGVMTVEEAAVSKERHMLTQYLGVDPEEYVIEPYFGDPIALKPGDRFLLCSDGISDMLDDVRISAILAGEGPARSVCDELISQALSAGGRDNATAMILDILGEKISTGHTQAKAKDSGPDDPPGAKRKIIIIAGIAAAIAVLMTIIFIVHNAGSEVRLPSDPFNASEFISCDGYDIDESTKKIWVYDSDALTLFLNKKDRSNPTYDDIRSAISENETIIEDFKPYLNEFVDKLESAYPDRELDLRPFYLNIRNLEVKYLTEAEMDGKQGYHGTKGVFYPDECRIYINSDAPDDLLKNVIPHEIGHMMSNYYGEYHGYTLIRDFCRSVNYGFIIEEGMDSLFVDTLYDIDPEGLPYQAVNNYSKLLMESSDYTFADFINGSIDEYLAVFGDRLSDDDADGYQAGDLINDLSEQMKALYLDYSSYDNDRYSKLDELYSGLYFESYADQTTSVQEALKLYEHYIDTVQFMIEPEITHPDVIRNELIARLGDEKPDILID